MNWEIWFGAFGLAVSAASAHAQPTVDRNCSDDRGRDRCAPAEQARARALFGMETIEHHRDAGEQVRRVFYVDGYGRDVVAIAFVRRPGHDPEVRIHFRREEGVADFAPLVAPVPLGEWNRLIERSTQFDRMLVSPPQPDGPDEMTFCIHSWVFTAEATDPPRFEAERASIRRRTEDACSDGLTEAFAREAYWAAVPLFPHCALLNAEHYRTPANQLAACGILSGDRMAAAHVRNRVEELFRVEDIDDLPRVTPLFDYETRIDWNGTTTEDRGAEAAARFFLSRMMEAGANSFFVESIEGLGHDRVRLRGGFVRFVRPPGQDEEAAEAARAEMIWHSSYGDDFAIQSVTVGPYERLPAG